MNLKGKLTTCVSLNEKLTTSLVADYSATRDRVGSEKIESLR